MVATVIQATHAPTPVTSRGNLPALLEQVRYRGKEVHPRMLFDRLFGGIDPNETAQQIEKRRKQSLLISF